MDNQREGFLSLAVRNMLATMFGALALIGAATVLNLLRDMQKAGRQEATDQGHQWPSQGIPMDEALAAQVYSAVQSYVGGQRDHPADETPQGEGEGEQTVIPTVQLAGTARRRQVTAAEG